MNLLQLVSVAFLFLSFNAKAALTESDQSGRSWVVGKTVIPQEDINALRKQLEQKGLWDVYVEHRGDVDSIINHRPLMGHRIREMLGPYTMQKKD